MSAAVKTIRTSKRDKPAPLASNIITIAGMGLMGGSLGMALVKAAACKEVRALVRREEAVEEILARGAAHVAGADARQLLGQTDMLVLATPVRAIESQVSELHRFLKSGAVITDMGSVKTGIVKAMDNLPTYIRALGGHPMCGKETSGLAWADPALFRDRIWVLTPSQRTDPGALSLVEAMIEATGARRVVMDAEKHDRAVSCVSHLPYVLAAALTEVAKDAAPMQPEIWELAADGFRDTSRIAASDLTMMIDILAANRENVLRMLQRASESIDRIVGLITEKNDDGLRNMLSGIRDCRMRIFQN
jgi:prephenate dehydrogenase